VADIDLDQASELLVSQMDPLGPGDPAIVVAHSTTPALNLPPTSCSAQNAQICAAPLGRIETPSSVQNGGYLRCAHVMVNYTALGEASPAAVSRCACASIAYGVRRCLGSEIPTARNSVTGTLTATW
jgi:hypothetical protein